MHSLLQLQVCPAPWEVRRLFPAPEAKRFTYCGMGTWEPWSWDQEKDFRWGTLYEPKTRWRMPSVAGIAQGFCSPAKTSRTWSPQRLRSWRYGSLLLLWVLQGGQCMYSEVRRKAVCRRKKWMVHFLESSGNLPTKKRFVQINSCIINTFWTFISSEN